jgi:hypothetical protein
VMDMPLWFWWALCVFGALGVALSAFLWPLVERLNERMKDTDLHFMARAKHPRVNEAMSRLEEHVKLRRCVAFGIGLALLAWGIFGLTR